MSPTSTSASAQVEPGAARTLEARYYTDPSIFKAEQEGLLARHPRRDVRARHVGHLIEVCQPVAGGEIDAHRPFLGRHLVLYARIEFDDFGIGHGGLLFLVALRVDDFRDDIVALGAEAFNLGFDHIAGLEIGSRTMPDAFRRAG